MPLIRRLRLLLILVAVSLSLVAARPVVAAQKRPNILFIYADDQSYKTVNCYPESYDWVRSPNIDSLARTGVRFSHAYIGTWCMPSRAAMLTGHLQFGVQSMQMVGQYPGSKYDPKKCPFWPKVFRERGYYTAQLGKWHTGVDTGFGRDWDYQKVWNRPRYTQNAGNYFYDQLIETNGGEKELVKGYSTDNYTDWAVDFIEGENRPADKPWFLWVCYGAVHGPFLPAERHREEYADLKPPIPKDIYPPREGKPTYARNWEEWIKGDDGYPVLKSNVEQLTVTTKMIHGNRYDQWLRQYTQGVLAIDEGVGRLVAALEKSGQRDNTLIVYTADQGFSWGEHGYRRKLAPYDATIRSPLIVNFPSRIASGEVCESPVTGQDLPPTFFAFAGLELPWKMHGQDLTPLLKSPQTKREEPALMVYTGQMYGADTDRVPTDPKALSPAGVPWWASLNDGRYKYIRTLVADEPEELYDLKKDPDELINLARTSSYSGRVRSMRKQLLAELTQRGAAMAKHLPPVAALPGEEK